MLDPTIIACAANGRFAMPLAVMIRSLLASRNPDHPVRFYICESDLSSLDRERLEATAVGKDVSIIWVRIVSIAGRWFQRRSHLSPEVHRRTVEDPWILHFAGDRKPWSLPLGQYPYGLYFRYLDQTPWAGWRPRPSVSGGLRAFYYDHLRENLYPLEALYTALRFHRLPGYLRYLRSHLSRLAG